MKRVQFITLSLLAVGCLGALWSGFNARREKSAPMEPLTVFCAAGIRAPVEAVARTYEQQYRVPVQLQYGGSGALLASLRLQSHGDLFLAADESYLHIGRSKGWVDEIVPLAQLAPVLAVRQGNPKHVRTLADLLRPDVNVALANPDTAAVGQLSRNLLQASGHWAALQPRVKVFKPTVNDIANDLKLGVIDAGIVWDATVQQYPELEGIIVPELKPGRQQISIGVLRCSRQPSRALHFARFLSARDRGLPVFARLGYRPVEGDAWAERPEVVLFSGGVNRLAIEETLGRFESREGVRITRVYNGCGILVAQMKAGQRPDAYFACDVSFMGQVADLFLDSTNLSQTQMVLLAAKDNPKHLLTLSDLTRPGLRVGIANPRQSALGALTQRMAEQAGLWPALLANVKTQTPTADLLVNQMRLGSLDAVIVYSVNTSQVRDQLAIVPIAGPGAVAVQPFAIARASRNHYLMERLLETLRSDLSRQCFEGLGFRWLAGHKS